MKIISKLDKGAMLVAGNKPFRTAIINKINQLCDAVSTGTVWDNKVAAERANLVAEQAITEQDLLNIENGIKITDLDLRLMEMEAK